MKLSSESPVAQRKRLVLLGLLLVTAAVVFYVQFGGLTTEVAGRASNTPAAARSGGAPVGTLPEALRLGALAPEPEGAVGGRDPFGFGVPPRPAVAAQPPAPPRVVVPPPAPPGPPAPAGPKPLPPIPVKFLGFAEDPKRPGKVVSLSVNGSVVLAREGEVIDGRYRLVKVGLESITMSYLDGSGQQVIRQQGG